MLKQECKINSWIMYNYLLRKAVWLLSQNNNFWSTVHHDSQLSTIASASSTHGERGNFDQNTLLHWHRRRAADGTVIGECLVLVVFRFVLMAMLRILGIADHPRRRVCYLCTCSLPPSDNGNAMRCDAMRCSVHLPFLSRVALFFFLFLALFYGGAGLDWTTSGRIGKNEQTVQKCALMMD